MTRAVVCGRSTWLALAGRGGGDSPLSTRPRDGVLDVGMVDAQVGQFGADQHRWVDADRFEDDVAAQGLCITGIGGEVTFNCFVQSLD